MNSMKDMMAFMMGKMGGEDMAKMMDKCCAGMKEEDKKSMEEVMPKMMGMMPEMMEHCFSKMEGKDMGAIMDMMPKMMEHCLPKMDPQQKEEMLGKCREMMGTLEKNIHHKKSSMGG